MSNQTNQTLDDIFDLAADEVAAGEQFGEYASFGQLSINAKFKHWVDRQMTEVDAATFRTLPKGQRSMEYIFSVNVQELNPDLPKGWERKVDPRSKDWRETVAPAIEAVLGAGSMAPEKLSATLRSLQGRYVEMHDAPALPRKGDKHLRKDPTTGEVKGTWSVPRLVRVFGNADEANAARIARFGEGAVVQANVNGAAPAQAAPAGWSDAVAAAGYDQPSYRDMIAQIAQAVKGKPITPDVLERQAAVFGLPVESVQAALESRGMTVETA